MPMIAALPNVIYVDARSLQDPAYRFRGVGQHASCIISALRRYPWGETRPRLVAVVDRSADDLEPIHGELFDLVTTETRPDANLVGRMGVSWFICPSPMTHDPVWLTDFLNDLSLFKIALFYDLIPLEYPEIYLVDAAVRMSYKVAIAWLRRYDAFAAISEYTAKSLRSDVAVDAAKVFVSGVAIRPSLEPFEGEPPPPDLSQRHVMLISSGEDPRKNPECALTAHAQSALIRDAGIRLVIIGGYGGEGRAKLRKFYAECGGEAQDLVFKSHLDDFELRQLYRGALATVVPSRAEGFSIPIIESSAAGTPVLVSDVGAHSELALDAAWRFDPDKPDKLRALFERLLLDKEAWSALQSQQAQLWQQYTLERVGRQFVDEVLRRAPAHISAPAVKRGARPTLAVLTPLPPAKSGISSYSASTLAPLKSIVNVHMFAPTADAYWEKGWASLSPVSAATYTAKRFDATLSVIGNSHFHTEILDFLLRYGGACLAHDARMIDFYVHLRGAPYAASLASKELGRSVNEAEIQHWLNNPRSLQTLFLSEVVKASGPLLVHSPTTANQIVSLYKTAPTVLPFAQYRFVPDAMLTPPGRDDSRRKLEIKTSTCLIVTFGGVGLDRGLEDLVWALQMLRTWSIDAHLVFCGSASAPISAYIRSYAEGLGLSDHITLFEEAVSEDLYRSYLSAADVGVQLRTYFMGGLSGALNDCIGAALPSVANSHLAEAMGAPDYVRRVPDNLSAVLIAEAILDILDSGQTKMRPLDAAAEFRRTHNPEAYCEQLLTALRLDRDLAKRAS